MTRPVAAILLVWAALGLTGCQPLYLPVVPDTLPPFPDEMRLREARIGTAFDQLGVVLVAEHVPTAGWLAVQWFPPSGREVASASVWLSEAREGRVVRVAFPDDVTRERPGTWRAVVSFDGAIVRQLEWDEPAGP